LGEEGSVGYQFKKVGEIETINPITEDQLMEVIDLGVEDTDGNVVYTEPSSLHQVKINWKKWESRLKVLRG
jgi:transcriptional/translational regulatory protein YebC/TACO1